MGENVICKVCKMKTFYRCVIVGVGLCLDWNKCSSRLSRVMHETLPWAYSAGSAKANTGGEKENKSPRSGAGVPVSESNAKEKIQRREETSY